MNNTKFVLDGNRRDFKSPSYEPLTDRYLSFFFHRNKVFKQLKKVRVLNHHYEIIDPSIKMKIIQKHNLPANQFSSKKLNIMKLVNSQSNKRSQKQWLLSSPNKDKPRSLTKRNFNKYLHKLHRTIGVQPLET